MASTRCWFRSYPMVASFLVVAFVAWNADAEPVAGKVALITGASSGIGLQVAADLAAQGMKVVLVARRTDKLKAAVADIKSKGGEAIYTTCDVSKPDDIAAAFDLTDRTFGGVDFVFANAGVEGNLMHAAHDEADDSVLKTIADVNIYGSTWATLKYAVKAFRKRGSGTIAFSSSVAALLNQMSAAALQASTDATVDSASHAVAYAASKSAVDATVRLAAGAYAQYNIRVYSLNIGFFDTEMAARAMSGQAEIAAGAGFNPYFKTRVGHPKYISQVILALLDGSSIWQSGAHIVIDNDSTIDGKLFYDRVLDHGPMEYIGWPTTDDLQPQLRDVAGNLPYTPPKDEL